MNSRLPLLFLCALGFSAARAERDPFWPIGYQPNGTVVARPSTGVSEAPLPQRVLTPEEMEKLAEQESLRIQQSLRQQGGRAIVRFGNQVKALINGELVGVGDTLSVDVGGQHYRLRITRLTFDEIKLEPFRIAEEPKP